MAAAFQRQRRRRQVSVALHNDAFIGAHWGKIAYSGKCMTAPGAAFLIADCGLRIGGTLEFRLTIFDCRMGKGEGNAKTQGRKGAERAGKKMGGKNISANFMRHKFLWLRHLAAQENFFNIFGSIAESVGKYLEN